MSNKIRVLMFDVDGVITDGRKYTNGKLKEIKSISYKDLDAITSFQKENILVGCISGESTSFSKDLARKLDYSFLGKKNKKEILEDFCQKYKIDKKEICYIGDGKYDIEALQYVGLSACPNDAIHEVKKVVDIILHTTGGNGCVAEIYTRLHQREIIGALNSSMDLRCVIKERIYIHCNIVEKILKNENLLNTVSIVCKKIVDVYNYGGQLLLCGNGGSAADAQHLAGELIGRFYLERKAYSAEALSTNTSVLTALANDYEYSMIFARQVEAKGRKGDILIGITTSGKSENIIKAFEQAKKSKMSTVLLSGEINKYLPVLEYTDYVIEVPSNDTPRIQEGHILIGHIICEIIETKLAEGELG